MSRRRQHWTIAYGVLSGCLVVVAACSGSGNGADPPDSAVVCPNLMIPDACPATPPSWKTEVQPLVETYCYACHGAGGVEQSAFDFSTYQGVKEHYSAIIHQLKFCLMPLPDAGQPTVAERQTLLTWDESCGAPNN